MSRFVPVFVLLAAAGCSRIKTAYTWLDWALEQQANQYLDLTREQSDAAETAIDSYLAWHRSTMLPRYARFLRQEAAAYRVGPPNAASYAASESALRGLYQQTMAGVVEVMADLLVDQSAPQITHLEGALAERHAELTEESRASDRLEERQEDFVELFEDLVGDLRDDQRTDLGTRVRVLNADPTPWLAERARRNRTIVELLRAGAERDRIASALRTWWMGEPDPAAAGYEAYRERFGDNMNAMIFGLFASLDEEQRAHLVRRLEEYASDFEELATSR